MNKRNPKGLVRYRSPGRRALAAELSGLSIRLPEEHRADPKLRRLNGIAQQRWGKYNTLPQGTPTHRRNELFELAQSAQREVNAYVAELQEAK